MDTVAQMRKPGRPRKSPQAPLQNPVVKRGPGRPPNNATTPPVTGSGVVVEPGKQRPGWPKLNSISTFNGSGSGSGSGSGVVGEPGKRRPGRPKLNSISTLNGSGSGSGSGSGVVVEPGKRRPGRPKLNSISTVNGGGLKRGRPKRVPLVTRSTGRRPKSTNPAAQYVSLDGSGGDADGHRPLSRGRGRPLSKGRGRPPKSKVNMNLLALLNSLGGPGTAALVIDPLQLVAYKELKLKYEHLQSKAKEVVGGVSPYINPEDEVFGALQELETLVGTDVNVQS